MGAVEPGVSGNNEGSDDGFWSNRRVASHFDRSVRTIDRWVRNPNLNFPQPTTVNGRKLFRSGKIRSWQPPGH
jgi:hypothetical protein